MLNHNITHIVRNPVAVASILTRHWGSLKKNILKVFHKCLDTTRFSLGAARDKNDEINLINTWLNHYYTATRENHGASLFSLRTQLGINNWNIWMGYPPGTTNVFPSRPDQFQRRWRGVRYCTPEDGVPPGYLDAFPSNFFSSGPSWPWHTGSAHASTLAVLGPFSLRASRFPSFLVCHSPPWVWLITSFSLYGCGNVHSCQGSSTSGRALVILLGWVLLTQNSSCPYYFGWYALGHAQRS